MYPRMSFRKFSKFWLRMRYGVQTNYLYYFEDTPWRQTQILLNSVKSQRAIESSLKTKIQLQIKMKCSVIGDLTEKLAQHDNYSQYGARKQFYPGLSRQLQNWGHQSTPPSCGQHNRLIIEFKPTLDGNWSWVLTFLAFPLSRGFETETRTGHFHRRNRLGQKLQLSDFINIRDPDSLLTRGLSSNRRLHTGHTKPPFRSVPSILPDKHDNIIRLLQVVYDGTISLR